MSSTELRGESFAKNACDVRCNIIAMSELMPNTIAIFGVDTNMRVVGESICHSIHIMARKSSVE